MPGTQLQGQLVIYNCHIQVMLSHLDVQLAPALNAIALPAHMRLGICTARVCTARWQGGAGPTCCPWSAEISSPEDDRGAERPWALNRSSTYLTSMSSVIFCSSPLSKISSHLYTDRPGWQSTWAPFAQGMLVCQQRADYPYSAGSCRGEGTTHMTVGIPGWVMM